MSLTELIDFLDLIYQRNGYFLVFISNFIETSPLGWLIPGGILVALGGFYSYNNGISFVGILLSSTLGMVTTLLLAYYFGKKTGMALARKFKQEANAQKAEFLLQKHGAVILTTSLLANLTRFWISYVAGIKRYDIKLFTLYAFIASLGWNSLLVTIGYFAGAEREKLESNIASLGIVMWILLFVALGVIYWKIDTEFKKGKNIKVTSGIK